MQIKRSRWPNSLQHRVVAGVLVGIGVTLMLACLALTLFIGPLTRWAMQRQVDDYAASLVENLQFDWSGHPVGIDASQADLWLFDQLRADMKLRVMDISGRVVISNDGGLEALTSGLERVEGRSGAYQVRQNGVAMYGSSVHFDRDGGKWVLQAAVSERMLLERQGAYSFNLLLKVLAVLSAALLIPLLALIYAAVTHALKPLRRASDAAVKAASEPSHEHLPVNGQPRELQALMASFNGLFDQCQRSSKTHCELLWSSTRELDVPFTLIRAQVELAEAGPWRDRLLADVNSMNRTIRQLLVLADACDHRSYRFRQIDPTGAINEAIGMVEHMATQRGISLGQQWQSPLKCWQADRRYLVILLGNLLECAIQRAPTGGLVMLVASGDCFSVSCDGHRAMDSAFGQSSAPCGAGVGNVEERFGIGSTTNAVIAEAHRWTLVASWAATGFRADCRLARRRP